MKIGIISDLHLGKRNYGIIELENDFYKQYHKCINELIQQKVDTVIIAGDIFDTPKVSPLAIDQFQQGLRTLNTHGINVLNIIGNHTMMQTAQHIPADKLFENEFSYSILDENYQYSFDDTIIMGLPYHKDTKINELEEKIEKLGEKATGKKHKILVLHQEFQEYCGFAGAKLSINDIPLDKFDIIICGHIHQRLKDELSNTIFIQPGSIERLNKTEAQDEQDTGKGITIINTEQNKPMVEFIDIPPERKYIIKTLKLNNSNDINSILDDLLVEVKSCDPQPMVFLQIEDETNSYDMIIEKQKTIDDNSLSCRFQYYDLSSDDYPMSVEVDGEVPSVKEFIREAFKDDDNFAYIESLYDAANNPDEDLRGVVDDLFKKLYPPVEVKPFEDPEMDEIIEYFENS